MGTEYALADHANRRLFELGKGSCWAWIFDPPLPDTEEALAEHIHDNLSWPPDGSGFNRRLATRLARFIREAGGSVSVVNDGDDSLGDLEDAGYAIVDARYPDSSACKDPAIPRPPRTP